jgi:hypothetical protein
MSGIAEASAIFGLITGSIELIKFSIEICKAAKGEAPSRIQAVADQLPSIVMLLDDAHANAKTAPNNSVWSKVKPDLERCKQECTALHTLFEKACPKSDSSRTQRAWSTTVAIVKGKRTEAEEHMTVILKTLSVLKAHHIIKNTELLEDVKKTLAKLEENDSGIFQYGNGDNTVVKDDATYYENHADNHARIIQTSTYTEQK